MPTVTRKSARAKRASRISDATYTALANWTDGVSEAVLLDVAEGRTLPPRAVYGAIPVAHVRESAAMQLESHRSLAGHLAAERRIVAETLLHPGELDKATLWT
jgi:hypothetical protein